MSKIQEFKRLFKIVNDLNKIAKSGGEHATQAREVIKFYTQNGYLTKNMTTFIKEETNEIKETYSRKFYLYAISDNIKRPGLLFDGLIKVGMGCYVNQRLQRLQNQHSVGCKLEWYRFAGTSNSDAIKHQNKMIRALKSRYVVDGWYEPMIILETLKNWRIN